MVEDAPIQPSVRQVARAFDRRAAPIRLLRFGRRGMTPLVDGQLAAAVPTEFGQDDGSLSRRTSRDDRPQIVKLAVMSSGR